MEALICHPVGKYTRSGVITRSDRNFIVFSMNEIISLSVVLFCIVCLADILL